MVAGYKKIENGVVDSYKKTETGVVEGFGKVVDKCVEALFAKDGESVEDAKVFAYTYGSLSAIIMGSGMSLVMTDIGAIIGLANAMVPGIVIGIAGMGMALSTCSLYKRMLNSRKKKYAPSIMALSEKLLQK